MDKLTKLWLDKYADVDGVRTHYIEAGEGETLLLVHGGGLASSAEVNYGDVIGPLSKNFHVLAVDIVGYGLTPGRGSQDYSNEAQGNFLIRFLDTLNKKAHLAGNSNGGWMIEYIAHERPDLVKKLVIINSLNGSPPIANPKVKPITYIFPEGPITRELIEERERRLYLNQELVTNERVNLVYDIMIRNYEFAKKRWEARPPAGGRLLYKGKHIGEYADQLTMPVLLTWGRDDTGATLEAGLFLYAKIPNAEMHIFPHARHHVMTEQKDRWVAVVTQFLKYKH